MVNTELLQYRPPRPTDYNILNIVVNTELYYIGSFDTDNYNILNIVVNTELSNST